LFKFGTEKIEMMIMEGDEESRHQATCGWRKLLEFGMHQSRKFQKVKNAQS
jgi:hypothetical protein